MTREAIVSATPALLGRDMDGAVAAVTRYRYHIQQMGDVRKSRRLCQVG